MRVLSARKLDEVEAPFETPDDPEPALRLVKVAGRDCRRPPAG
jgi:hypothetical protein